MRKFINVSIIVFTSLGLLLTVPILLPKSWDLNPDFLGDYSKLVTGIVWAIAFIFFLYSILNRQTELSRHKFINALSLFFVVLGAFLAITPFLTPESWFFGPISDWHLWGDYTGGVVGSCWALAGTLFIYSTFLHQREVTKTQSLAIHNQNFESTFFNMLNFYRNMLNEADIKLRIEQDTRDGFTVVSNDLQRLKKLANMSPATKSILEAPRLFLKEIYYKIEQNSEMAFNLSEKDNSKFNLQNERKRYYRIVKASMNTTQLEVMIQSFKLDDNVSENELSTWFIYDLS